MQTTVLKMGKLLGISVLRHFTKHLLLCKIIMEVLFDTVLLLFAEKRLHSTENKHASPVGGGKVREERPEHVQ